MGQAVQRMLSGMPAQHSVLVVHQRDGEMLVAAGGVALVGPYRCDDAGARNLGMVMLTQMGFGVGQVADAFGLRPGTVSHLLTAFRRGGSVALVKTSGRPAALTEGVVAEVRRWLEAGASQQQAADRLGVTQAAISWALRRHPAPAPGPIAAELDFPHADADPDAGGSAGWAGPDTPGAASPAAAEASTELAAAGTSTELVVRPAAPLSGPAASGLARSAAGRVATGGFPSRYAGAMLAYSYLDRSPPGRSSRVWTGPGGGASTRPR